MKTIIWILIAVSVSCLTQGCTDASMAQYTSVGTPGHITCYSGGVVFYQGDSTGKISTEHSSDGWFFKEKGTGDLIRVSGQCLIRN